eukprot:scaffold4470_cov255-Prasinococcus_capsulatus_cf.AAC.14
MCSATAVRAARSGLCGMRSRVVLSATSHRTVAALSPRHVHAARPVCHSRMLLTAACWQAQALQHLLDISPSPSSSVNTNVRRCYNSYYC